MGLKEKKPLFSGRKNGGSSSLLEELLGQEMISEWEECTSLGLLRIFQPHLCKLGDKPWGPLSPRPPSLHHALQQEHTDL